MKGIPLEEGRERRVTGSMLRKGIGFALILAFFCLGTWRLGRSFLAGWHDRRGQIIEAGRQWTGAIAEYRQAVRLEGRRVEYRLRLADALARRGQYGLDKDVWLEEARAVYRQGADRTDDPGLDQEARADRGGGK